MYIRTCEEQNYWYEPLGETLGLDKRTKAEQSNDKE